MKWLVRFILVSAFSLLLSGCDTYEYNFYGNINGTVVDYDDNSPIDGASVLLMPGSASFQTQPDGSFFFVDLEEGQYTMSVQKNGYQSNRKIIKVVSGENIETAIQIRRIQ